MKSTTKCHLTFLAQTGVSLLMLLSCVSGLDNQETGLIAMDIDIEYGNGWYCKICRPDSCFIDTTITREMPYHDLRPINLWGMTDSLAFSVTPKSAMYPIYVHRPSGQTDTLHESIIHSAVTVYIGVIRRRCKMDSCIVLETVFPGKVLGRSYLVDENLESDYSDYYPLRAYSYEGQKKIFESRQFHYWILKRFTTDWYGPMTEQELTLQLKDMGIPLPLTLKDLNSPYVMPCMANGHRADIPLPTKHIRSWPRDKTLGDKIIE